MSLDLTSFGYNYNERDIARYLAMYVYKNKSIIVLPNTYFTGNECDILVVHSNLKLIDIEIKVSRADFKADINKDKWWMSGDLIPDELNPNRKIREKKLREWPRKTWKHYYCMPHEIWKESLEEFLPSSRSGIMLIKKDRVTGFKITILKNAKPNPKAKIIEIEDVFNIARLSGIRMWKNESSLIWHENKVKELNNELTLLKG